MFSVVTSTYCLFGDGASGHKNALRLAKGPEIHELLLFRVILDWVSR